MTLCCFRSLSVQHGRSIACLHGSHWLCFLPPSRFLQLDAWMCSARPPIKSTTVCVYQVSHTAAFPMSHSISHNLSKLSPCVACRLVKAGVIPQQYARRFSLVSAWAELVGYVGSITLSALRIAAALERERALTEELRRRKKARPPFPLHLLMRLAIPISNLIFSEECMQECSVHCMECGCFCLLHALYMFTSAPTNASIK